MFSIDPSGLAGSHDEALHAALSRLLSALEPTPSAAASAIAVVAAEARASERAVPGMIQALGLLPPPVPDNQLHN